MSMDRLVELFLESARPESERNSGSPPFGGGWPDDEAIERGIETVEKLMTTEDAIRMGGTPAATFVCMGMAMEEKPKLSNAALRCYEKALEFHGRRNADDRGGWERCVVLQQMGAVGMRVGRYSDAKRWLDECAEICKVAPGHPRDAILYHGAFNTKQTRMELAAIIEKMRAQASARLGDQPRAYEHLAEAKRLESLAAGDAVERQAQLEAEAAGLSGVGSCASAPSKAPAPGVAGTAGSSPKELWAAKPDESAALKQYRFMDEGPTVLVILELNEHLGMGEEASEVVTDLKQFRVQCEADSVHVQLRVRRRSGRIGHFELLLAPLAKQIIPEDTVPRLRGKESKRRLEIKLFKYDKTSTWYGDIVQEAAPKKRGNQTVGARDAKGSLLNPLSEEELARLPKPYGGSGDNRPSSWQQAPGAAPPTGVCAAAAAPAAPTPPSGSGESRPSARQQAAAAAPVRAEAKPTPAEPAAARPGSGDAAAGPALASPWPRWVASVEERDSAVFVALGPSAGEEVSMQDLELDADPGAGTLRLRLPGVDQEVLELRPPVDLGALVPKWRRKARTLELGFPPC